MSDNFANTFEETIKSKVLIYKVTVKRRKLLRLWLF